MQRMKSFLARGVCVAVLSVGSTLCALFAIDACGGSTDAASSGGSVAADTGTGDGGVSTVSTAPGSCANSTVSITFAPMYSAYIPGSTAHTFQIPSVTTDGSSATWSVSDPTQAQLAAQSFDGLPGVMITLQGVGNSGALTIFATKSDGTCGAATLDITSTTEDDWQIGSSRYNDGVALHLGPPDGGGMGFEGGRPEGGMGMGPRTADGGSFFEVDGGTACTNCHGPTATSGPYKDVSHTPEQTGGFSDDDLIAIITTGTIPDGGYFDPTVINTTCDGGAQCTARAYQEWSSFHRWTDIESDQYKGIITYLRSLQPASQNGASNFGGRPDGGGRPPRDGG